MSIENANAALDRMEADEAFAQRFKVAGGPEAAQAMLAGESLEATPDEMRDALVDRYGDSLTQEQLDALAGGADDATIVNLGIIGVVAGAAAAAAV